MSNFIQTYKPQVPKGKVKKIVAILFVTIYAATAFGVIVNFHYCNRVITHMSRCGLATKNECDSHSFMAKDCCKDKTICFQLDTRNTTRQTFILTPIVQTSDLIPSAEILFKLPANITFKSVLSFRSCQRAVPQTIYLLNRVFRI